MKLAHGYYITADLWARLGKGNGSEHHPPLKPSGYFKAAFFSFLKNKIK